MIIIFSNCSDWRKYSLNVVLVLLGRVFVGDFVELKNQEVNVGDSKEVGVLIHVNDHDDVRI